MPPPGKGKPLTKPEVARLRSWIDQGASWGNAAAKPREAAVRPRTPEQTTPTVPNADAPTEVVESLLPPAAGQGVDFTRDIHPILQRNCLKCHGPEKPRSSFRLDNRTSANAFGSGHVDLATALANLIATGMSQLELRVRASLADNAPPAG